MAPGGHHCEGEHHERGMPVPPMPGAGLVVGEPELRLGSLERVLDGPTPSLDGDERADRRAGRAPGREVRPLSIGQAAADQKPARPQPRAALVVLGRLQASSFSTSIQERTFAAVMVLELCPSFHHDLHAGRSFQKAFQIETGQRIVPPPPEFRMLPAMWPHFSAHARAGRVAPTLRRCRTARFGLACEA
jgi:hypothetical protein